MAESFVWTALVGVMFGFAPTSGTGFLTGLGAMCGGVVIGVLLRGWVEG